MTTPGRSQHPPANRSAQAAKPSALDRGISIMAAVVGVGIGLAALTWGAGRHLGLVFAGAGGSAFPELLTVIILLVGMVLLLFGTLSIAWSASGFTIVGTVLSILAALALVVPNAWLPSAGMDRTVSPAVYFSITGVFLAVGLLLLVLGAAGRAARRDAFARPNEGRGLQRVMSAVATVVIGLIGCTGLAFGSHHVYTLRLGLDLSEATGSARWTPYLVAAVGLALLLVAASFGRWSGLGPTVLGLAILAPGALALGSPAAMVNAFSLLPEMVRAEVTGFVTLGGSLVLGGTLLGAGVGITIARTRAETKTLAGRHGERGYYLPEAPVS